MSDVLTAAVIVAGGTGERLGRPGGKQLAMMGGRPVLSWTLAAFDAAPEVDLIVVVCHPERIDEYRTLTAEPLAPATPVLFAPGGDTRQASVSSGLALVPYSTQTVVVHDGARPLVTPELIASTLEVLAANADVAGVVVGFPAVDTLKVVDGAEVLSTPDRARFWMIQTPQTFRAEPLRAAYFSAQAEGFLGTDDSSLVERAGGRVLVVAGPRDNIKVTVAEDLVFAEAALGFRKSGERS
jgi:2-C-methyl-D-erythritol 4-phosphate cytidylyltransferase